MNTDEHGSAKHLRPSLSFLVLVLEFKRFAGGLPVHETDDATWVGIMNLNLRAAWDVNH